MFTPLHLMPDTSKVWIYQANRTLSLDEVAEIEVKIENFVEQWQSHTKEVKGYGAIYYRRFIILMADENVCDISGCSIDSSVKFIKELQEIYQIDFFNRMQICYKIKDDIVGSFDFSKLNELLENQKINDHTLVFNNLVNTKQGFENSWMLPLRKSTFANFIKV